LAPERDRSAEALRKFIVTLFEAPTAVQGKSVWGFKVMRYGSTEARAIAELFPRAVVIPVTRDPRDILRG
jgi:hypothetical protein